MNKKRLNLINLLILCGMFTFSNIGQAAKYVDKMEKHQIDILIEQLENEPVEIDVDIFNPFLRGKTGYV